jgi:prepilin-type N-terminal cleavage/methylation domain-containing protein
MSMKKLMAQVSPRSRQEQGFTVVELVVASVIFSIIVIGLTNAYNVIRLSYSQARQVNEMYTVLSACPEVDRALEFNSISSTGNCYPNNSFPAEDGSSSTVTYTPTLTVTSTSSLTSGDPLQSIPDSKVVDISVGYQNPYKGLPNIELKMLITRNGIGQT